MPILKYSEPTAANRRIHFECRDSTTLQLQASITFSTGELKLATNGTQANATVANITNAGNGSYFLELTQAETETIGILCLVAVKTGTQVICEKYQVVGWLSAAADSPDGITTPLVRVLNDQDGGLDSYLNAIAISSGLATSATSSTITLTAGPSVDISGKFVWIFANTGQGQKRSITAYNTGTGVATITPNWDTTPDATSFYVICDLGPVEIASKSKDSIVDLVWSEAIAGYSAATGTMGKYVYDLGTGLTSVLGYVAGSLGTGVKLIANAVTSSVIQDGAITAAKLASDAITSAKIADGTITAAKLASDCITDAKVASDVTIASVTGTVGSVTGSVGSIASGGISTASFVDASITSAKFASDAFTAAKFAADVGVEFAARVWQNQREVGYTRTLHVAPTVVATLTTTMTGANNDITLTSVLPGTSGNSTTLAITNDGNNITLSVDGGTSNSAIVVHAATNGSGTITSTAAQVVAALMNYLPAKRLFTAKIATGSDGTGVVTTLSATNLASGAAGSGSDSNDGLSLDAPKATIASALAAATAGDLILLQPGVYLYAANSVLPAYVTIRGAGQYATSIRLTSTLAFFQPNNGTKLEKLYIDARNTVVSGIYTSLSVGQESYADFDDIRIESNSYGVWAARGTDGTVPAQHWRFRRCDIRAGISAFSSQGNASVNNELFAWDCIFSGDSYYYGPTIPGNSYAALSVYTDMWLMNCHLYGRTTTKSAIAGGLQCGDPTALASPGKAWMSGGSCYAVNTARTKAKRITGVSIASEAVFTCVGHGLTTGNYVGLNGIAGTGLVRNVNGTWKCTRIDDDTFKIRQPITDAFQSTVGGTYVSGSGNCHSGIEWAFYGVYAGSEMYIGSDVAFNTWSVKMEGGAYFSCPLKLAIRKLSILQSGKGEIVYVQPNSGTDHPVSKGWEVGNEWQLIQDALLDATWGDTIYIDLGETGCPLEITEPLYVPPGVNIDGHGPDRTVIVYNGVAGSATDGVFILGGNNKIEKLTIREGASCTGVSGFIASSGANTIVIDHVKCLTTFDCLRLTSSTASSANVENCRFVSSTAAAIRATGAAHVVFVVGDHPYTKGATAVILGNGARCTINGLAETSGSYVFDVDGSGSLLSAAGANFDGSLVRTTNSGVIRTEENVADILLDRTDGADTGWSLRRALKHLVSSLRGKTSGLTSGSGNMSFRNAADTQTLATVTVDANGNRTSVTLGD